MEFWSMIYWTFSLPLRRPKKIFKRYLIVSLFSFSNSWLISSILGILFLNPDIVVSRMPYSRQTSLNWLKYSGTNSNMVTNWVILSLFSLKAKRLSKFRFLLNLLIKNWQGFYRLLVKRGRILVNSVIISWTCSLCLLWANDYCNFSILDMTSFISLMHFSSMSLSSSSMSVSMNSDFFLRDTLYSLLECSVSSSSLFINTKIVSMNWLLSPIL